MGTWFSIQRAALFAYAQVRKAILCVKAIYRSRYKKMEKRTLASANAMFVPERQGLLTMLAAAADERAMENPTCNMLHDGLQKCHFCVALSAVSNVWLTRKASRAQV